MPAIEFLISADGPTQKTSTRWFAEVTGDPASRFLVGQTVSFTDGDGKHRGLYQTRVLSEIPALLFDRQQAADNLGLWAHFIWPTVVAESAGGHHLVVNSYDRARFTFGFYQLAAHTPGDNLILLFRDLLALPSAADYFPELFLNNGRVHHQSASGGYSLEQATKVHRPNGVTESQLVSFMSFLNPDSMGVGDAEARTAARLMHWLLHDPAAVVASERVAFTIMQRKVRSQASTYQLRGKDPRLAIWVSDIRHQGRGTPTQIKSALSEPSVAEQLAALHVIGAANPGYDSRRTTVRRCIATLTQEGVFTGVNLGDPGLALD